MDSVISQYIRACARAKSKKFDVEYELELRINNNTLPKNISLTNKMILSLKTSGIIDKLLEKNNEYLYNYKKKRFSVDISSGKKTCVVKTRLESKKFIYDKLEFSLEDPVKCDINVNPNEILKYIKLKYRESYVSKLFPNWRFDFTKVYYYWNKFGSAKSINEVKAILKDNVKLNNLNFQNEFEIEYIGNGNKNDIINDIIFFNDWISTIIDIPKWIIKQLNIKKYFNIMNNVVSLDKNRYNYLKKNSVNFAVSEKKDGERNLIYIGTKWNYMMDKSMNITYIGENQTNLKNSLLDVEKIEQHDKSEIIIVFDILIHCNQNVTRDTFKNRLFMLKKITGLRIAEFNIPSIQKSLGLLSKKVYAKNYKYDIDGLIFTPIIDNYYSTNIFKWKPGNMNTIDFLVMDVKVNKDKTYSGHLYVLISKKNYIQRYGKVILSSLKNKFGLTGKENYFPMQFDPENFEKDKLWKFTIKKQISDGDIAEMCWNKKGWKLLRIRDDKTKLYKRGREVNIFNGANSSVTAYSNWKIIQNPITLKQITNL